MDGYLASPMVADPLRALDCCLVNDGGVAFVMTNLSAARDLRPRPVVVAGAGFGSKPLPQSGYFSQSADLSPRRHPFRTPGVPAGGPRSGRRRRR
jgi:hypothetical protein